MMLYCSPMSVCQDCSVMSESNEIVPVFILQFVCHLVRKSSHFPNERIPLLYSAIRPPSQYRSVIVFTNSTLLYQDYCYFMLQQELFQQQDTSVQLETRAVKDTNKIFESKIVNIFLPISSKICFKCSKESSH